MVLIFVFSVVSLTFYSVFSLGIRNIMESRNRLGALALANEKMEIVRNLEYDQIGTVEGIPAGDILEEEALSVNAGAYRVKTLIKFVDNPLDGVFPDDSAPNDYKMVKIAVSWGDVAAQNKEVNLISNFSPPSLESSSGNGILSINIVNSTGAPVSQATVHVVNHYLTPTVNVTQETNNDGNIMFIGAPPAVGSYELTVSKSGYETVGTIDPDTVFYTPVDSNASVIESLISSKSIVIDKLAELKIKSVDNLGNAIPNVDFHIKGGRILGTRSVEVPPETVYILDDDVSTNANGEKEISNHSPGQFYLSNIGSVSGYTLIGVSSSLGYDLATQTYQFSLLPDESKNIEIKYADNNENALLVKVLRDDNTPIQDAQVKLTNATGYDQTVTTSLEGVAFFPTGTDPLVTGDYSLEIKATGFQDQSSSPINIDKITNQEIKLIAN